MRTEECAISKPRNTWSHEANFIFTILKVPGLTQYQCVEMIFNKGKIRNFVLVQTMESDWAKMLSLMNVHPALTLALKTDPEPTPLPTRPSSVTATSFKRASIRPEPVNPDLPSPQPRRRALWLIAALFCALPFLMLREVALQLYPDPNTFNFGSGKNISSLGNFQKCGKGDRTCKQFPEGSIAPTVVSNETAAGFLNTKVTCTNGQILDSSMNICKCPGGTKLGTGGKCENCSAEDKVCF